MTVPLTPPSPEEGRRLHQRLWQGDPLAKSDLAFAYLRSLTDWLREHNRRASEHDCTQAAEDALLGLMKNPQTFDPQRTELFAYLKMAARRDLINLWRREHRHQRRRSDWESVENHPEAGKCPREEDPVLRLCRAEDLAASEAVVAAVRERLPEAERPVLDLILSGERKNSVYAEAYGVAHLPPEERDRVVNRLKDKIKHQLKRAGGGRG